MLIHIVLFVALSIHHFLTTVVVMWFHIFVIDIFGRKVTKKIRNNTIKKQKSDQKGSFYHFCRLNAVQHIDETFHHQLLQLIHACHITEPIALLGRRVLNHPAGCHLAEPFLFCIRLCVHLS